MAEYQKGYEDLESMCKKLVNALVELTDERASAYGAQYNSLECPGAKAIKEHNEWITKCQE